MKKITLFLFLLTASFGFSQNVVDATASTSWVGYNNVFPDCQGSFGYFIPNAELFKVTTTIDIPGNTITLQPQVTEYDAQPGVCVWDNGAGAGGSTVEGNTYIEPAGFADQDLTFQGRVSSNTLDGAYTGIAFIKGLDPNAGFADVVGVSVPLPADGTNFSISATAAQLSSTTTPGIIVQYGFSITGRNLPGADAAAAGSIVVTEFLLDTNDFKADNFNVSPNPTTDVWTVKGQRTIKSVNVYDVLGKQVMNLQPNRTDVSIDATTLPKGLYFARVATELGSNSIKLIKN
jgi:hypothetical protein